MSRFYYQPITPYSNPAGIVEKQTNEMPTEMKTATVKKKRTTKKKCAKKDVAKEQAK